MQDGSEMEGKQGQPVQLPSPCPPTKQRLCTHTLT